MKSFRNVVDGEVRFSISPDSRCPCGSGVPASACCLTATGFRKTPATTTPHGPKTRNSVEACYASRLGDCGATRSREHYVSESLLHHLNQDNNLTVSGLPWLGNEHKVVSPDSLASKVLCERHNSALSPLDAIAVSLFQAFDEQDVNGSGQQLIHLFSGHDVERWLLKILCGITCSKNLALDSETEASIPDYWLDILFCGAQFPDDQGLYVCTSRGHRFEGPRGLKLQAIVTRDRVSGMGLWICGYELILSMVGFPTRSFDGREVAYRPLEFYATGRDFEKSVVLSWDGSADLGTVSVEIAGT